jgi:hypothetical protein
MFKSKKKNHESDVHIEVLRFAKNNPGFSMYDLEKAFPENFNWIWRQGDFQKVFIDGQTKSVGDPVLYLSFDGRFKLLEHEELQQARQSSTNAFRVAIVSILISVSLFVSQIGIQLLSVQEVEVVNHPIQVEQKKNSASIFMK